MKLLAAFLIFMTAAARAQTELRTIEDRVTEYGAIVQQRLAPHFQAAGVSYPPRQVALVAIKQDRVLQVYAAGPDEKFHFIRTYPVLAASGHLGPKKREGDRQVPEGIYRVRELNPNSRFHLSLWLDYPNAFDRARATAERRSKLGGEIMIHGNAVSIGCLAMGDPVAEDLFILAAATGIKNVRAILTPVDLRQEPPPVLPNESKEWMDKLYPRLKRELMKYPPPPASPEQL